LPADVPLGLRIRFLQQIKTAGRSDLTQLEKEENLRQRYKELTKEVMEELISRGQDPGFAPFIRDTILPTLLFANQSPNIEDRISILESLLKGIKGFTTSSKITIQDKERGLRIETRTQPVKKTATATKTTKTEGKEKEKGGKEQQEKEEPTAGIILPPSLWMGVTYPGGMMGIPITSTRR
jgi:hypothetical protein